MRTLLRICMYAVAIAAGVDTYLYGGWWTHSQIVAVLAGLAVTIVTATVPWKIYVALRRSAIARKAFAPPATADLFVEPEPPPPGPSGPARDAPFREAAVLPAPRRQGQAN
jgi:hypothetical protein